jgi:uncharacterized protein
MVTLSPPTTATPTQPVRLVTPVSERASGLPGGDPGLIGLPSFIVGAIALGLALIGVVPTGTTGASVPIILAATSIGLMIATVWAAILGQSAVAGIYGIFTGFYLSYAVLVLGLVHNWFGITPAAIADTQKLFVISWMVIVTVLVVATLRLPVAFTGLFALVDVALLLNLLSIIQGNSTTLAKSAGWVVMAFSALGLYMFFGAASHATGGKELPVGRPILRT